MNEWMDVICWIVYVNYTLSCPSSWGWELDDDVWLLEVEPAWFWFWRLMLLWTTSINRIIMYIGSNIPLAFITSNVRIVNG